MLSTSSTSPIYSFKPITSPNATVLILGSMPGVESLRAAQYYAHPRNAFWPIMGELAGAKPHIPYAERTRILLEAGIAVWDVLQSCVRPGSLDSDIESSIVVPNNFTAFFASHPHIRAVFFNGAKAEECFRKQVLPTLENFSIPCKRLPSTSPAHASLRFAEKLQVWGDSIRLAMG
ncbi:MAG: DNA-deoxyinosine glycosylase [Limnobacter sp.]|nr:DNA-deoxyinosine glycosylase [Limnobacter sp.]